jgi:rod shape determining protein RodA
LNRPGGISFDAILFAAVAALLATGVLFIYSSGVNASGVVVSNEFFKQILWGVTGIGLLIFFSFFSYTTLRLFSLYIYAVTMFLLLLTPFLGREVNGAHSWLGVWELGIQPSEFAKISTILFLGTYLTGIGNGVRELPRFLLGFLIALLPFALTLLQPDMGTALVFLPVFLVMAFAAGAKARHLLFILAVGILTVVLAAIPSVARRSGASGATLLGLLADGDFLKYLFLAVAAVTAIAIVGFRSFKQRYFYWIAYGALAFAISSASSLLLRVMLKDYQIMRLIIFTNPQLDPQGAGWNILQSVTAVGSGGFWGKGYLQGTQSHYRFLPQQSTDFIFSILAEEWGFLGGLLVLGLFLVILLRGMSIVWSSREDYAILIGSGILAMIFFHVLVNVGMAMGIMPVTGIPLPLLSYGGSSLWTAMVGMGILMNISRRRLRH